MKHLAAWVLVMSGVVAGQQSAYAASDSVSGSFWGGVNLKYWMASYNPSEGFGKSSVSEIMPSFVVGYDRFFYTLTFHSQPTATSATYPASGIKLQEQSFGFGYNLTSNIALVVGQKGFAEMYTGTLTNSTKYTTLAAVFNWTVPDSQVILFGNLGTGKGKSQANPTPAQNNYNYTGYEFGVSYPIYTSTKASLGYKSEQFGLPHGPTSAPGVAKMSGLFAGVSYSF